MNATPLIFFDYEGTLGKCRMRHYYQYRDMLQRMRLDAAPFPPEYLQDMAVGDFLAFFARAKFSTARMLEQVTGSAAFGDAAKKYQDEVVREYAPQFLMHDRAIDGAVKFFEACGAVFHPVIYAVTGQDAALFAQHLNRLGFLRWWPTDSVSVHTLPGEGREKEVLTAFLHERYGGQIRAQAEKGRRPFLIGDTVADMAAALEAGLNFAGVYETGTATREDFYNWIDENGKSELEEVRIFLFPAIDDPRLGKILFEY